MAEVVARQHNPIARNADPFLEQRIAHIISLSVVTYADGADYKKLYQEIYKNKTASERWAPRKLKPAEIDDLLSGIDGRKAPAKSKGDRSSTAKRSSKTQNRNTLAGSKEDEMVPSGCGVAVSKLSAKDAYLQMIRLKSERLQLQREEDGLTRKNENLRKRPAQDQASGQTARRC